MDKDRVTIQEAARRLGVKDDAIRKRIQRGSIEHEKGPDGRVYVYLGATHDTSDDEDRDATRHGQDLGPGASGRAGSSYQDEYKDKAQDSVAEALREQIAFLRAELEDRKEEARRKDAIIMSLTQRVPELTSASPQETPGGPEASTAASYKDDVPPAFQEPTEKRSWLYRFFFGP